MEFFLNGAEPSLNSLNSANSGNLINWNQFKGAGCYLCLVNSVVTPWSLTQEVVGSNDRFQNCCHWIQWKHFKKKTELSPSFGENSRLPPMLKRRGVSCLYHVALFHWSKACSHVTTPKFGSKFGLSKFNICANSDGHLDGQNASGTPLAQILVWINCMYLPLLVAMTGRISGQISVSVHVNKAVVQTTGGGGVESQVKFHISRRMLCNKPPLNSLSLFTNLKKVTLPIGTGSDGIVYSDVPVNSHCSQGCYADGHWHHSQVIRQLACKITVRNLS